MTKYKIIPIAAILIILLSIFFAPRNHTQDKVSLSNKVFKTNAGWGYNILVNDSIYIHQEIVPVLTTNKGFDTEPEARAAADMVIKKLLVNKNPMLSQADIEAIILNKGQQHDQQ